MSLLVEAIQQVKECLLAGETVQTSIQDSADDYKLSTEMLYRRFTIANNGQTPEAWLEGHKQRVLAAELLAVQSREKGMQKARELALTKWRVQGQMAALAGRVFSIGKREYAYVVMGDDDPAYAIRSIDLETQRIVNFPRSRISEIVRQIAPQLQLAL